jgi:hypothetical protein
LAGTYPGDDEYCDSEEITETSYTCTDIPRKADKRVYVQLQVIRKTEEPKEYTDDCVYITEKSKKG